MSAPPGAAGRRHGHQPSGSQDAHKTGRNQYLHVEFRSAVFGFVDDMEFYFSPPGTIQVRSASRTGYSDFGVNRERVETLRTRFSSTANSSGTTGRVPGNLG
ncbi:MAG TPA: DUF1499 domain-containing protein [Candidatus Competibacteraceae bacterium]|nr:DUF1499 domain-containing protein [Candidatus Competibacteraceae bacterium]HRZ07549.1 DUF1499 domain-containing protein [Candidatus Competibacteraceae bacterium]HSA47106.1 DUF1499 domain-containing protein [Candidatus Competibacteraceae bacterium]